MSSETWMSKLTKFLMANSNALLLSLGSAAIAVILYKTFKETESDLNRRLERSNMNKKPIRIWVDGCFDLFHFGHANALRQARALGNQLIVGINSDAEVLKVKGPPIMSEDERCIAVAACKWVDKVVTNVPYVLDEAYLKRIFDEYEVDYIVHGDDPCLLPDGSDVYALAKQLGKFKIIKRTEGVSTTDIVGRMLMNGKLHHHNDNDSGNEQHLSIMSEPGINNMSTNVSRFLPTSRRITQFASGKSPKPNDVVVYIDGDWDLFHAGHIDLLKLAKTFGDFLIVGIHRDSDVNKIVRENYPIMNLHERVLSVLSCKYVDEVIIGAPWVPNEDLYTSLNIKVVLESDEYSLMVNNHNLSASHISRGSTSSITEGSTNVDRFAVAKRLKIYHLIKSPRKLTTIDIVERVYNQMSEFAKKYEKKSKKEVEYVQNKEYVTEI